MKTQRKKKILVAPLNWGLGHATRCIPLIGSLLHNNFEVVIAGDGDSLTLLKHEFPGLKHYELPGYHIQYAKQGSLTKLKLFGSTARILKIIRQENKVTREIVEKEQLTGIISDNRFGVRSEKVASVYLTHQLRVKSGIFTGLTSSVHQKIIAAFDECWVPDFKEAPGLAGDLSHPGNLPFKVRYIGPLSRFTRPEKPPKAKKYALLVLLSGPEPQRSILEKTLLNVLITYSRPVLFVRGVLSDRKIECSNKKVSIRNFLDTKVLQKAIPESETVIARSGYSTIMDLHTLGAKAFFIPTPGQDEQKYLAALMDKEKIAPFSLQHKFELSDLKPLNRYTGFKLRNLPPKFPFEIFS